MKAGSIVETVGDFTRLKREWGFDYPNKGDVLTVSRVEPHHNPDVARHGISLLYFEEKPGLVGICDRTTDGRINFVELTLPPDIEELLEEPKLIVI